MDFSHYHRDFELRRISYELINPCDGRANISTPFALRRALHNILHSSRLALINHMVMNDIDYSEVEKIQHIYIPPPREDVGVPEPDMDPITIIDIERMVVALEDIAMQYM